MLIIVYYILKVWDALKRTYRDARSQVPELCNPGTLKLFCLHATPIHQSSTMYTHTRNKADARIYLITITAIDWYLYYQLLAINKNRSIKRALEAKCNGVLNPDKTSPFGT